MQIADSIWSHVKLHHFLFWRYQIDIMWIFRILLLPEIFSCSFPLSTQSIFLYVKFYMLIFNMYIVKDEHTQSFYYPSRRKRLKECGVRKVGGETFTDTWRLCTAQNIFSHMRLAQVDLKLLVESSRWMTFSCGGQSELQKPCAKGNI